MIRKRPSRLKKKYFLLTTGALLLVNAGVAHILFKQINPYTSAETSVLGTETVADKGELVADDRPADSAAEDETRPGLTIYTVKSGDTISGIAQKHGISVNTIRWANELEKTSTIKPGQELVILPINGIQYTVKNGDTISGIAKKFDAEQQEILDFNDLDNPSQIKAGVELIIPDAEPTPPPAPKKAAPKPAPVVATKPTTATVSTTAAKAEGAETKTTATASTTSSKSKFANPAPGSVLTQGLHAVNAVDFGAKIGTPILAAESGTVVVAKGNGAYNGGFGNFIVISHGNGVQTLYAHLSKVQVSVGQKVDKGEQIGLMGSTGKSTGSHLHFEIHNSGEQNPYSKDKKGTRY